MLLDLIALDPSSRVWIYQADRLLSYDELDIARDQIEAFLGTWTSHNQALDTYGNIFHRQFLGIFVDQSRAANASGCSIDASVRFVQDLGNQLGVDFFNRDLYGYFEGEDIHVVNLEEFKSLKDKGSINAETLVFDPLVDTKEKFIKKWILPLEESWIKRML